jgi:tryptophanyl-tRNA synthetase
MPSLPEHYDSIRAEFDYDRPDFDLGPLSASLLDRAFAATTDAEAVNAATDNDTLFVASAGLTGTPHVGTVAQMMAVKRLDDAGFDTQFLIADYEKYAGSGRDLDVVRDLAADYETFLDRLGYEGRVRTQYDAEGVMHTAFRLAPWFEFDPDLDVDHELTDWEQALDEAYEADQIEPDDATGSTAFAGRLAGLLCLADFMHPSLAEGYDQAVFILGIDEHALDIFNRHYVSKMPFEPAFEGLFTRMVSGLNGYPKMSKTIPGSGITMDMAPERVRELVLEEAASERNGARDARGDAPLDPAESTVYQMLCLVSEHDGQRLAELEAACREGGAAWDAACEEYADYLADLASLWPER